MLHYPTLSRTKSYSPVIKSGNFVLKDRIDSDFDNIDSDEILQDESEINPQSEPEYNSRQSYLSRHLIQVHKKKFLSKFEQVEAGKAILKGKEADKIISFIENKDSIDKDIEYANSILKLIKTHAPENFDGLTVLLKEDELYQDEIVGAICAESTPAEFFDQNELRNNDFITQISKELDTKDSLKILNYLAKHIKKGTLAQRAKDSYNSNLLLGNFTPKEIQRINLGLIPERIQSDSNNGLHAQHKLIDSYANIAYEAAKKYKNVYPFSEGFSEANLGLVEAARRFDYIKNDNFYFFAKRYAENYIQKVAYKNQYDLMLTNQRIDDIKKLQKARNLFIIKNGKKPTAEEIQEKTGFSEKKQQLLWNLHLNSNFLKFNNRNNDAIDKGPWALTIHSKGPSPQKVLLNKDEKRAVWGFIKGMQLTPSEEEVYKLLYRKNLSQQEAADVYLTGQTENNDKAQGCRQQINNLDKRARKKIQGRLQEFEAAQSTTPEEKKRIQQAMMEHLSLKERQIIRHKLGFYDPYGNILTDKELGEVMGIKPNNANGIFKKAIKKMEENAGITEEQLLNIRELSGVKRFMDYKL